MCLVLCTSPKFDEISTVSWFSDCYSYICSKIETQKYWVVYPKVWGRPSPAHLIQFSYHTSDRVATPPSLSWLSAGSKPHLRFSLGWIFCSQLCVCCFFNLFLIEGKLLYSIVLVSAKYQHESTTGIPMSPPSWISLPPPSQSHPSRLLESPNLSSLSHTANSQWNIIYSQYNNVCFHALIFAKNFIMTQLRTK